MHPPSPHRVPTRLTIDCDKKEARGEYTLRSGEAWHGLPVWERDTRQRESLYSDADGRWIVGTVEVMKNNAGWVMSGEHSGRLPHEVGGWMKFASGEWVATDVTVSADGMSPWPDTATHACSNEHCNEESAFLCAGCEQHFCSPCKGTHGCRSPPPPPPPPPPIISNTPTRNSTLITEAAPQAQRRESRSSSRVSRAVPIHHHASPMELPQPQFGLSRSGSDDTTFSDSTHTHSSVRNERTIETLDRQLLEEKNNVSRLEKVVTERAGENAVLRSQLTSIDTVLCAVRDERDAACLRLQESVLHKPKHPTPTPLSNPLSLATFVPPHNTQYSTSKDHLVVAKGSSEEGCSILTTVPIGSAHPESKIHLHFEKINGPGRRVCVGVCTESGAQRVDLRADGEIFVDGTPQQQRHSSSSFSTTPPPKLCFGEGDAVTIELDASRGKVHFSVLNESVTVPLPRPKDFLSEGRDVRYHPCLRLVAEGDTVAIVPSIHLMNEAAGLRRLASEQKDRISILEAELQQQWRRRDKTKLSRQKGRATTTQHTSQRKRLQSVLQLRPKKVRKKLIQ